MQIVYLPFFDICVLTVVCAICATSVQSRVSEQTHRNRRRSSINKHLSKIIVFTIRQRKIIRPKTARIKLFAFYTLFTSKIIIMLIIRLSYCNRLRLRKKTQSTTIVQKKCTYPQVENITILPEHLFSLKKTTSRLLKRQRLCSIRVSHFPRRVSMIIFFQSKSFMRRRVRRYRLRHKIHAIKTRPNNPLRFLKHKNVSVAISQTI